MSVAYDYEIASTYRQIAGNCIRVNERDGKVGGNTCRMVVAHSTETLVLTLLHTGATPVHTLDTTQYRIRAKLCKP